MPLPFSFPARSRVAGRRCSYRGLPPTTPTFCHSNRSRSASDGVVESLAPSEAEGNLLLGAP
jgi:hypothetical protein